MARVFVSIGSNIDRERNVAGALDCLRREFGELQQSTVYETEPMGFEGDPFYNLVVAFDSDLDPREVAAVLHRIEDRHGRERGGDRFGARTLDLDLLLYDDLVVDETDLKLPRPEILVYAFVLRPLAEIAGQRRHPLTGTRFAALWEAFERDAQPMWPVAK